MLGGRHYPLSHLPALSYPLFEIKTCYVAQRGLELIIILPQPAECWDDRYVPPHLPEGWQGMGPSEGWQGMGSSQGCLRQVLGPLKLGQTSGWTLNQRTKTVHVEGDRLQRP